MRLKTYSITVYIMNTEMHLRYISYIKYINISHLYIKWKKQLMEQHV